MCVRMLSQGTLNKLREERGAAQQVMRQHSQWLQGFREQVAQVAALQPAVASKLQHSQAAASPSMGTVAALRPQSRAATTEAAGDGVVGGPGVLKEAGVGTGTSVLSPVASGLLPLLGGSLLTMGQPVTVDLGGDQELVLSVVHKSSAA